MAGEQPDTDALGQNRPGFRSAVIVMENSLHDEDLESMKFLCQGLVVGSKLKRVGDVHELVNLLESAKHVTETDFYLLADLLQYIKRIDVLESIGYEEEEVIFHRRQHRSNVHPFYVLLFQISEELPDEDVKKAKYMYGKIPRSAEIMCGLDLFKFMVQHQAINVSNVEPLLTIFSTIERQDLVELINRYIESEGWSVVEDLEENFRRALSLQGKSARNFFPAQAQPHIQNNASHILGPLTGDVDVTDRSNRDRGPVLIESTSSHTSLANHPPSMPHVSPSAPPRSLPSLGPQTSLGPQALSFPVAEAASGEPDAEHSQPKMPVVSAIPAGFDNYVIPGPVLNILSTTVPNEHWQELSSCLGVPLMSGWKAHSMHREHKLAVLKRWMELPETQSMNSLSSKIMLVHALTNAGSALLAEQIAEQMGLDYGVIMQESSSRSSVYEENAVASETSAMPESMEFSEELLHRHYGATHETMTVNFETTPVRNPIPHYSMNRFPRGRCFIINNRDFYKDPHKPEAKQMASREGSDIDRDKLKETFTKLHFDVVILDNLTDIQMIRNIQQIAFEDHSFFDCFVCCILTHGVQGHLYGVNGMCVPIRDLTSPLRAQSCFTLSGKPKLFFLQACQGREKQEGHLLETDSIEVDSPPELIPNEADFLLGYATVPGFVSYRSKTRGSWYITKLTESLNKYAYDHDILDILTLVNFEVGRGDALIDGGQFKQSPAPMYSLRKKLIFTRPSQ